MMLNDLEKYPNKLNWAFSVKSLLESMGFNNVWLAQGVGDMNLFLAIFKQRLSDNFIQGWNDRIQNSTRAKTYSLFSEFSYKIYLDVIKVEKFRTAFSRFRMSSHRLQIEVGRWHKPQPVPLNERKCLYCNIIEDEFHFVLECQKYNDIRKRYINKYYWGRPNIPKFVELITSSNSKTIKNLAAYIVEAFKIVHA